jgi:hypothetical protein
MKASLLIYSEFGLYSIAEFSPSRKDRLTSEIGCRYSDFRCIALSDLPRFCSLGTAEVVMVLDLLYLAKVSFGVGVINW